MKEQRRKKKTKDEILQEKIEKILFVLNSPETSCAFWRVNEPNVHIMGIRPVKRNVVEVINPNGFNPYDKKTEENLFKCFKILVVENKKDLPMMEEEISLKKEIEKNGIIYIKSHDLIYIIETVRKSY